MFLFFCRPIEFQNTSNFTSCVSNLEDTDEGWLTEEYIECMQDENLSTSGSNSNVQKTHNKHYPPKLKDLSPGFTVPVEVCKTRR